LLSFAFLVRAEIAEHLAFSEDKVDVLDCGYTPR